MASRHLDPHKVTPMMFVLLLVPVVLLGLVLGMERIERWTVDEREDTPSS